MRERTQACAWPAHGVVTPERKDHRAVRASSRACRSREKYAMKENRKQCVKKQLLRAMRC